MGRVGQDRSGLGAVLFVPGHDDEVAKRVVEMGQSVLRVESLPGLPAREVTHERGEVSLPGPGDGFPAVIRVLDGSGAEYLDRALDDGKRQQLPAGLVGVELCSGLHDLNRSTIAPARLSPFQIGTCTRWKLPLFAMKSIA